MSEKLDSSAQSFKVRSKVVIKSSELPPEMIEKAVELADAAINSNLNPGDAAEYLKSNFDKLYSPFWNCIVGKKYSSMITHEAGTFLYFYIGNLAVLLFK